MSLDLVLDWKGPFSLASRSHRTSFAPPASSGVYLWTVANDIAPRIAYVGEASNLAERFYGHAVCTLGGAYCLYDDDHLVRGNTPVPLYRPSQKTLFTNFLDEPERFATLGLRNLMSYWFWWAVVDAERNASFARLSSRR